MKLGKLAVVAAVVVLLGMFGCKSAKQDAPAQAQPGAPMPAGHPPVPAMAQAPAVADSGLSGKVVETVDAGGYTYVCLEKNGKKSWVALPQSKVKVGQMVTCQPGTVMQNFTSKTLNRTFDTIIFSGGLM